MRTSRTFVKNSRCIQRVLLNQLKPEFIPKELHGLKMQSLQLTQMLRRTIEDGENSLVLIEGRRGSGKSILTRHVLEKFQKENKKVVVVGVNGYSFTSDHAALKHLNERIANSFLQEEEGLEKNRVSNTVAANIVNQQFFQRTLQDLYREGATVVIVLEQFEAFARQSRQSMLYNILDLTQHQDTRMAVICITRQINSAQRLEKRIRSRFDLSRQIILSRTAPDVDVLTNILKARLTIPKNTSGVDENCRVQFNRAAATAVEGCKRRLEECRRFGLDIRWLFTCVSIAVSKLHRTASNDSQTVPKLLSTMLIESMKTDIPGMNLDSIDVLEGLTEPALTLLIAFKRLRDRRLFECEARELSLEFEESLSLSLSTQLNSTLLFCLSVAAHTHTHTHNRYLFRYYIVLQLQNGNG